ncbi:MFS transporter [Streptomyces sp. NA04227]|uniref:MFS transporter n=1 Tax=Streptomyces sp. NA04227 TaxID=2742136 RepID=UPI0015914E00|nr:MFS transporter [Streptomyces sp. NA04227]QKW08914.1 MFS transporter [Streptomyces sp. NA04227]
MQFLQLPTLQGPLQSRNFRLLVTCNAISVTGTSIATVAIPFAVLDVGGSAGDVGLIAAAKLVPLIAFLLIGGVIADRWPRHRVLVAANVAQAAAEGAAAGLVVSGHAQVWHLGVLSAIGGMGVAVSYPAAQGLLPHTVPAAHRQQAVALDRMSRNTASIVGAALGGLLVAFWGAGLGLGIDAASFAIAAALRFRMSFTNLPQVRKSNMISELRQGWRTFTSRRWLWVTVALSGVFTTASSALIAVLGPLAADLHLGGARSWGFIVAAYGFGAVVGGMVLLRFRPRRILLAGILSFPALSLLFFALAIPLTTPVNIALSFLAGAFLEIFEVGWAIALQQEIPPEELSRISSYDAFGNYALSPAGTAAAGGLADAFGLPVILTCSGVLIVLLSATAPLVPEIRNLRGRPPGTSAAESVGGGHGDAPAERQDVQHHEM